MRLSCDNCDLSLGRAVAPTTIALVDLDTNCEMVRLVDGPPELRLCSACHFDLVRAVRAVMEKWGAR